MVVSVDGLGVRGARFVPGLLITITCVGWFGIQAAACGASFSVMTAGILGFSIPAWASGLFWGAVMTVSAVNGYRVLRTLSFIMVPVLLVLLVYTVIHGVFFPEAGSAAALLAWRPAEPVSYTKGISLILGTWSLGAFYIGDYCRYGEKSRDVTLSLSVCLILMIPLMFLSGAVFRIIAKNPDITVILTGMGYPATALVFLILATWTTNIMNAYSGGIALSILLGHEEKRLKINTVLTGITGTVLGAAGILSRFTEFLSLLSSFVPPLIGVLIGAKIVGLLRRGRNEGDNPLIPSKPIGGGGGGYSMKLDFHIPGLIAYALGALAAWITTSVFPFFIPPLNGIITAAAVYVVPEVIFSFLKAKNFQNPPSQ
jgi:cytosine permease